MSTKSRRADGSGHLAHGRVRQKQRTRRELLDKARELIAAGAKPSVTDVADAAGISRRTAYRYFPSQQRLLVEAALEGFRPAMEAALAGAPAGANEADIELRLKIFVRTMQRLALDAERFLRTMVHETVLEKDASGLPLRGGRRVEWVELAIQPVRRRLTRAAWDRLVTALCVTVGIEALLVQCDIRGLTGEQSIRHSEWMAIALLRDALAGEAGAERPRAG